MKLKCVCKLKYPRIFLSRTGFLFVLNYPIFTAKTVNSFGWEDIGEL